MAMSQFSVGALASYRLRGEMLPVAGGYDVRGELTHDPAAIEASGRLLPIGFWKGSGLSLMLDLAAAVLSGGRATHQIPVSPEQETALSQVFIALLPPSIEEAVSIADAIVDNLHLPFSNGETVRYPGERTLETRRRNLVEGVPVEPSVWETVQQLLSDRP